MRRAWGLLGVAAAVGVVLACSPVDDPFCPNGVWPFDGQSAVPLDAVIVVRTGSAFPDDVPPLHDAVALFTEGGRRVPTRVEVHPPSGEIRLVPTAPLRPDTRYELHAVDWYQLAEYPHWWGSLDQGRDFTITTFATGSAPELLEALSGGDDGTLVVAFSEPVDLDTLEGRLWLTTSPLPTTPSTGGSDTGTTTEALELEVLGAFDGDPHLVWVQPLGEVPASAMVEVRLLEGGRTASGEPLPPDEPVQLEPHRQSPGRLRRFSGAPYCF